MSTFSEPLIHLRTRCSKDLTPGLLYARVVTQLQTGCDLVIKDALQATSEGFNPLTVHKHTDDGWCGETHVNLGLTVQWVV